MSISDLASDAARQHQTAQSMVASVLRKGILDGVLKSGEPLRQDRVAKEFGVSKMPVREALRQLEGEGLVIFNPYRGAVVSELSYEEIVELGEMKVALETLALRHAIPKYTKEDLQRAEEILDQAEVETTGLNYAELSRRFHSSLYAPAGFSRLLNSISSLDVTFDRYIRIYLELMHTKDQAQVEHRQILEYCKQRDLDNAVESLENHIRRTAERIQSYLQDER